MFTTLEYAVTSLVCLVTAVVIQRIYNKERKRINASARVRGILWFGWAIFVWGFGSLFNWIMVSGFGWSSTHKVLVYLGVLVSLLNSLFILLSLPSIEHKKKHNIIKRLLLRFSEREFFILFGGIMLMLAFVFIAATYVGSGVNNSLIWLIDIPVSVVVAFALLNELNKAFNTRNMRFMYLPSFSLFVLILIAVTHRIFPEDQIPAKITLEAWALLGTITAISFKFLFILLFSILLYSWKFLSETEIQQAQIDTVLREKEQLANQNTRLEIANRSHLDTISHLEKELEELKLLATTTLSERQKEVLGNLGVWGNEKSYTEIADAMHISIDGFQTHIHQIKKILNISGADGKKQLIRYALEKNITNFASISEI